MANETQNNFLFILKISILRDFPTSYDSRKYRARNKRLLFDQPVDRLIQIDHLNKNSLKFPSLDLQNDSPS